MEGIKETQGKLNYEFDWDFIKDMGRRMSKNKEKYPPYNWTKPMDIELLKQSLFGHALEVMGGNYQDEKEPFGHLTAIALNAMFISFQLKNIECNEQVVDSDDLDTQIENAWNEKIELSQKIPVETTRNRWIYRGHTIFRSESVNDIIWTIYGLKDQVVCKVEAKGLSVCKGIVDNECQKLANGITK